MKHKSLLFTLKLIVTIVILGITTQVTASHQTVMDSIASETNSSEKLKLYEKYCLNYVWTEPVWADSLVKGMLLEAKANNNSFYLARALYFKGVLLTKRQKLKPAFEVYSEAREILETLDNKKQLAEIYHNLGLIHFRLGEKEDAKSFLEKAKKINSTNEYTVQLIKNELVLTVIGNTASQQIEKYKEIGEFSKAKGYLEGVFLSKINVATLFNNIGQPDSALYYLGQAEDLWSSSGFDLYLNNIYQLKGLIYNRQKDYVKAEKYLKLSLFENEKKDLKNRISELYLNLASVYYKLGQHDSSYHYHEKHRNLKDQLDLKKKAEAIAQIKADYEWELKENENILLRKEAELNENQLQTAKKQELLLSLVLLVSLIAIGLLTARYYTKQKYLKELEKVNQKLNEFNLEMENILQVVSHDFRTPLAKIKMLSELIESNTSNQLTDNSKEKLVKIGASVDEAEELVTDILEIKSFYNDEDSILEPMAFSIVESVNAVIELYEHPIHLKNLKISYEHDGDDTIVQEEELLKRVISNILSNAVKFIERDKNIWINSTNKEGVLRVEIKDNGPGFSEKDKQKIFKKFAEYSNKPIGWGTSHGLGLFIVKKLVDRLQGTIHLESELGNGSLFIVEVTAMME